MNLSNLYTTMRGSLLIVQMCLVLLASGQLHKKQKSSDNVVAEMQVVCHSDSIVLKVNTNTPFNGMLYAKDAPASNNCMAPFNSATNMTFRLPLKSCGTLSAEVDDGIEYFNTIVVQPHMRLMTNQGKGYHVRCKYQTRERTIANTHFNVSAAFLMQNGPQTPTTPLLATASMPSCTMKIYRSGGHDDVAETVKIGDKLIMVIEIDQQDMYGMKITSCVVRDGMNKAAQELINDLGCPVDENIMPKFEYSNNYTRAAVSFPAHKFPHTSSVYYQCNVRLCINANGGCEVTDCSTNSGPSGGSNSTGLLSAINTLNGGPRRKRFVVHTGLIDHKGAQQNEQMKHGSGLESLANGQSPLNIRSLDQQAVVGPLPIPSELKSSQRDGTDMSFDVYSGLYVNDIDVGETNSADQNASQMSPSRRTGDGQQQQQQQQQKNGPPSIEERCMSTGRAGVMVVLASLASVGLVLLIACQVGLLSFDSSSSLDQRASQSSSSLSSGDMLAPSHNHHHHYPPPHRSHYMQHSPRRPTSKHHFGVGMMS